MTAALERRLQRARDRFVIEVVRAVEEAILDGIEQAFSWALATRPRFTMSTPVDEPQRALRSAPLPHGATASAQATQDRVLASVHGAPGSHIGQLTESLGLRASTVRRHLRTLAAANAIRIEAKPDPRFGRGRPLQLFFPRKPGNGVRVEHAMNHIEART